jgi:signal transduction histidine kinase
VSYIGEGSDRRIVIRGEKRGDRVQVTVEDNGIGIPTKCRSTIFQKFRRGTNVTNTSGTGLGLAIVKGLVEAHGGQVELDSREGHGCRFEFDLAAGDSNENDLHEPSDGDRYETVASGPASGGAPADTTGERE